MWPDCFFAGLPRRCKDTRLSCITMWKKSNLNTYSFEDALTVQGIKGVLVCCIRMLILSYAIDAYLCLCGSKCAESEWPTDFTVTSFKWFVILLIKWSTFDLYAVGLIFLFSMLLLSLHITAHCILPNRATKFALELEDMHLWYYLSY